MICTACGQTLDSTARFCSSCGQALLINRPVVYRAERLTRPRDGRMLAGVCAGFAQRYGWEVVIVRLIVLLAIVFAGVPVIAYLIAWVVMPNEQYALPAQTVTQGSAHSGAGPGSIAM